MTVPDPILHLTPMILPGFTSTRPAISVLSPTIAPMLARISLFSTSTFVLSDSAMKAGPVDVPSPMIVLVR